MRFAKAFSCAGKMNLSIKKDFLFYIVGSLGALILLWGHTQAQPQAFYILGSTLLLIMATYFHLFYFIALELILIAGHSAILLGLGKYLQISIPILLCFQLVIYYIISDNWKSPAIFIGVIGIALLSIGFSWHHHIIFLFGSSFIATYAWLNIKAYPACIIWAITNTIFAFICLYHLGNTYYV